MQQQLQQLLACMSLSYVKTLYRLPADGFKATAATKHAPRVVVAAGLPTFPIHLGYMISVEGAHTGGGLIASGPSTRTLHSKAAITQASDSPVCLD